jgi:uncharacterized membrane protein
MSTTVQPTPPHASAAKQSPADEMADRVTAASLDRLIAALPDAVDQSMRTTVPHLYTPELAASLADAIAAELRARHSEQTEVTA